MILYMTSINLREQGVVPPSEQDRHGDESIFEQLNPGDYPFAPFFSQRDVYIVPGQNDVLIPDPHPARVQSTR